MLIRQVGSCALCVYIVYWNIKDKACGVYHADVLGIQGVWQASYLLQAIYLLKPYIFRKISEILQNDSRDKYVVIKNVHS